MLVEIFIYLVIAFGILIIAITMCDKNFNSEEKYYLTKDRNSYVKVTLEVKGLSKEDKEKLEWILKNGKYENIEDIVDKFEIIEK